MAVTVVHRPQGHKIIDQAISAIAFSSFYFDTEQSVLVNFTGHGLSNGDFVYVVSDIDEYNGFWEVEVFNINAFYLTEGGVRVPFYQDVDLQYYQTQPHDWSSIFLPIVYKISNDRWPTNSVDSPTLIVLNADDNGFTSITTASPLKADVSALEFLKISGASTPEANGVWQIVEVDISNVYVINLPFELSGSLIGATVQYYYNNYQVKIKVYAGLSALHPWYSKKPFAEVAELSLTPDDNNLVMFSVSDYIKMKVAIKNNLILFSLPLNLDAFTWFYVSTAESYDYSDNYSLLTHESAFVVDSFEGYAIAGKLEFKNVYAGDYADFVYTSGSPARWLTNRYRLLAVEGYYFDVSFIKNIDGDFFIRFSWYVSDYLTLTEDVQFSDQGIGVYRIPVVANANYDSVCLQAFKSVVPGTPGSPESETPVSDFPDDMSTFVGVGTGDIWSTSTTPAVTVTIGHSRRLRSLSYSFQIGTMYKVTITYTKVHNSGAGATHQLALRATDTPNAVYFETLHDTTAGSSSGSVELEFTAANPLMDRIHMQVLDDSNVTVTINTFVIVMVTPAVPPTEDQPAFIITEEICIDMLEACDVEGGFVSTEGIRLLEDGGYRLLE